MTTNEIAEQAVDEFLQIDEGEENITLLGEELDPILGDIEFMSRTQLREHYKNIRRVLVKMVERGIEVQNHYLNEGKKEASVA